MEAKATDRRSTGTRFPSGAPRKTHALVYLAEILKPKGDLASICVKIAAIEKRSTFLKLLPGGDYIGIELGGDATADLNLDDFMVFDNDEQKAVTF